jgi:hypothetical protein
MISAAPWEPDGVAPLIVSIQTWLDRQIDGALSGDKSR